MLLIHVEQVMLTKYFIVLETTHCFWVDRQPTSSPTLPAERQSSTGGNQSWVWFGVWLVTTTLHLIDTNLQRYLDLLCLIQIKIALKNRQILPLHLQQWLLASPHLGVHVRASSSFVSCAMCFRNINYSFPDIRSADSASPSSGYRMFYVPNIPRK